MRVLSFFDLHDRKGIRWSRQHLARMIKAGKVPRPLRIGEATIAWTEDEVDRWLSERRAGSRRRCRIKAETPPRQRGVASRRRRIRSDRDFIGHHWPHIIEGQCQCHGSEKPRKKEKKAASRKYSCQRGKDRRLFPDRRNSGRGATEDRGG